MTVALAGLPVEVTAAAVQAAAMRQDLARTLPVAGEALCGGCDGQTEGEGGELEHAGILSTQAGGAHGIGPGPAQCTERRGDGSACGERIALPSGATSAPHLLIVGRCGPEAPEVPRHGLNLSHP